MKLETIQKVKKMGIGKSIEDEIIVGELTEENFGLKEKMRKTSKILEDISAWEKRSQESLKDVVWG